MLTLVTGLGRCGLSLVMQMLDAGGVPVVGNYPAYEVARGLVKWQAFGPFQEHAVKIVDPVKVCRLAWSDEAPPCRAIYLYRISLVEQARSALVMATAGLPGVAAMVSHEAVERLAASYRNDEPIARARIEAIAGPRFLPMAFEFLVSNPTTAAAAIADFMGLPPQSIEHMAAQARPRGVECQNLAIERQLLSYARLRTPAEAVEGL